MNLRKKYKALGNELDLAKLKMKVLEDRRSQLKIHIGECQNASDDLGEKLLEAHEVVDAKFKKVSQFEDSLEWDAFLRRRVGD